jgi:hypothetical protein
VTRLGLHIAPRDPCPPGSRGRKMGIAWYADPFSLVPGCYSLTTDSGNSIPICHKSIYRPPHRNPQR